MRLAICMAAIALFGCSSQTNQISTPKLSAEEIAQVDQFVEMLCDPNQSDFAQAMADMADIHAVAYADDPDPTQQAALKTQQASVAIARERSCVS